MVVDVRLTANDRVQVSYVGSDGQLRSLLAKRVVMACPKHICKYVLHDLDRIDPDKLNAMHHVHTSAYVVANVLLDAPVARDFYDVFLLGDGSYPMNAGQASQDARVVDMLNGHYARRTTVPRSVLTLYWPLPFPTGRFTLITSQSWQEYAERLVPQIQQMLGLLGVSPGAVRQVRLTRWGHALPIARVGFIADGHVDNLRRPFEGRVYFVNQDNWALPAVENAVLDAAEMTPEISAAL